MRSELWVRGEEACRIACFDLPQIQVHRNDHVKEALVKHNRNLIPLNTDCN